MVRPAVLERQVGSPQSASALKTIRRDPYFEGLIPLASKDERRQLVDSVFRDGVAEPLIVWVWNGKRILMVGYDLYPILQKHRLPFRLVEKQFPHREAARLFLIRYITSYRLSTPLHMSYLRGLYYLAHKGSHGGDRKSEEARKDQENMTLASMAEMLGVNQATLYRDGQFAQTVDGIAKAMKESEPRKDVAPYLLANVTRARIMALRGADLEEQKRVLKALMMTGRMPKARSSQSGAITLPRDPVEMVSVIERRLGREHLESLAEVIEERLQKSVTGPA